MSYESTSEKVYTHGYRFPGVEDLRRVVIRYKGIYDNRISQHIRIEGSRLFVSDDANSHLERICEQAHVRPKKVKVKLKK